MGQMRRGALGDGGAVVNRTEPSVEFTTMGKKNIVIGCAVTAAVLVGGLAALGVWGVKSMEKEVKKADISPSVYESVNVGDSEADVLGKLPARDSWVTLGLEDQGPKPPEGATCRYFTSDEGDDSDTFTVFRFCFREGKLVAKDTFEGR
ncbi:hypothetical protein [Streptomyces sp. NPDC059092]|uniref:hypothetical protein n=1 Tax=Streptomyces sp. NPDC059092 TaxID=3346725 RepID=UPI0036B39A26